MSGFQVLRSSSEGGSAVNRTGFLLGFIALPAWAGVRARMPAIRIRLVMFIGIGLSIPTWSEGVVREDGRVGAGGVIWLS